MRATKHDKLKNRWDLLPMGPIQDVVRALTFGSKKYADHNWKKVVKKKPDKYFAAMLRHIAAWRMGEKFDGQSGLSHLAHATCCLIFLMWHEKQNVKKV